MNLSVPPLFVLAMKPTPQASRSFVNAIGPSNMFDGVSDLKAMFNCVNEHRSCDQLVSTDTPLLLLLLTYSRSFTVTETLLLLFQPRKVCGRNAYVATGAADNTHRHALDSCIVDDDGDGDDGLLALSLSPSLCAQIKK